MLHRASRYAPRRQMFLHVLLVAALLAGSLGNALPVSAASTADTQPLLSNQPDSANPDRSTPPDQPAQPTASGPAMYLNGASDVNVPNASLPVIGSGDFTLEAWVYPTNVTGFHAVLANGTPPVFGSASYNGKLRFYRGSTTFVESTASHSAQSLDAHRRQFLLRCVGQRLYGRILHQRRSGRRQLAHRRGRGRRHV